MTSDTSLAMTVQDSIRLLVVVKGIELEESASCPGPPGRFESVLARTATEAARLPLAQAKGGVAAIGNG